MTARLEYDVVALNRVISGKPTEADRCPEEFALDWQSNDQGTGRQSVSLLQPGKPTLTQLSRITLRVDDHQQLLSVMVCLYTLLRVSLPSRLRLCFSLSGSSSILLLTQACVSAW